jgi:hypothetical protein
VTENKRRVCKRGSKDEKEIKVLQEEFALMELRYRHRLIHSRLALQEYYSQPKGIHFR